MRLEKKSQFGFTLLELLLVIAIMTIIFSISIINYDKMGRQVELENATYNMALTIREAQLYGINKKSRDDGVSKFGEDYRYGTYFNRTNNVSGVSNTKFIIYLDRYLDGHYDKKFTSAGGLNCTGGGNDECYSQVLLTKGNHISGIYFYSGGSWINSNEEVVDISFIRPNPDAEIIDSEGNKKTAVRIIVKDRGEELQACVDIGTAGNISIYGNDRCNIN